MKHEPLDVIPVWGLLLLSCILGGVAIECGYRLGAWRHARTTEEKETPVGAMVGSILGLLAFMLAFTFSLAASRYEERRQVVLQEANAIGTTYLRSRLLPEPHRSEAARLLREYVNVRVRAVEERKLEEGIAQSEILHEQLWTEAVGAAENKNGTPVMTSLFVQSLNELIDLHAKRITIGMRSRIPISIWIALYLLAFIGMGGVGYQAGLSATRRSPAMVVLVLAFAGVLFLIADLDRSFEGLMRINQQAMIDVQRSMQMKS